MRVWPPGPCPPTGLLRGDGCDLGVRLLETCYTATHIQDEVRPRLRASLQEALSQGNANIAATSLQGLLDTWPVAALVDAGVKLWTERAAAAALPVLGRAADLLCLAHGWPTMAVGPWPMPDPDWIGAALPAEATELCGRGPGDGAGAVADLTGLPRVDRSWALPAVGRVRAEDLVAQRAEITRRLVHAEIAAVAVEGALPDGPEAALALGEIRLEGLAQRAYERFGIAGLLAPRAPSWSEILRRAPAGKPGSQLRQICDTAILPGPPAAVARGEGRDVGWLLWRGPHPPVPVQSEAVALLGALDGSRDLSDVAAALGVPEAPVTEMAAQLVALGAATA